LPELRWILLILGVLFLGWLVWRESARRPRKATPLTEPLPMVPAMHTDDDSYELPIIQVNEQPVAAVPQAVEPLQSAPPKMPQQKPPQPNPPKSTPRRTHLSVRLAALPGELLSGVELQAALTECSFLFGIFNIFHKANPTGDLLVSAANLTKPGSFDLDTFEAQSFAGLSLFIQFPGPLPDTELFAELMLSAQALHAQLPNSRLLDDQGEILTNATLSRWYAELKA
jgi:cell division protein ZipA